MKCRMILLLILIQATIVTKTSAQFFGVTQGASFTPLSTLDVRGTIGATLYKDTSTSTLASASAAELISTVIFSNHNGNGRIALQIPAASATYLNRVYIIANTPSSTGGKDWPFQGAVSYTDLYNKKISTVPQNTCIMIICDGTNWLQIN